MENGNDLGTLFDECALLLSVAGGGNNGGNNGGNGGLNGKLLAPGIIPEGVKKGNGVNGNGNNQGGVKNFGGANGNFGVIPTPQPQANKNFGGANGNFNMNSGKNMADVIQ